MFKMKNRSIIYLLLIVCYTGQLFGQPYGISKEFHKDRRSELRNKMPYNTVAVLFSAPIHNRANDVDFIYHQDPNFYYLTGWSEPHAVLVIYKTPQTDEKGTYDEVLYVRERNVREELWNGKRKGVAGALAMDFDRVKDRKEFTPVEDAYANYDRVFIFDFKNDVRDFENDVNDLYDLQQRFKTSIHFPNNFDRTRYQLYQEIQTVSESETSRLKKRIQWAMEKDPSLSEDVLISAFLQADHQDVFQELKMKTSFEHRAFNFDVEQLTEYMTELREIKSAEEIALLRKAIRISAQGQIEVMKAIHPEMTEREVQGIHQFVYKKYGAAHEGYPSIVGAGHNACVLHYITNDKKDIENQLILMDLGAEYEGYTADVTRTIPVSGRFTEPQRELYQIVYDAQIAGIERARVGGTFRDITNACYQVVKEGLMELGIIENPSEFRRYLPHGVSHHIGLDVHDPGKYESLEENMVITVEPGIYIPENSPCDKKYWDIGIRIEDDILITANGPITVSDEAPRKWDKIEAMMEQSSPLDDFKLPEIED